MHTVIADCDSAVDVTSVEAFGVEEGHDDVGRVGGLTGLEMRKWRAL